MSIHRFNPSIIAGNHSLACSVCLRGEAHETHADTVTLPMYGGKRGTGKFRILTIDDVKQLASGHVWFVGTKGDARECKVNGAAKTWKRDANRVELPVKYGMYEYARFDSADVLSGRVLQLIARVEI